jgi:hypothetical protein
MAFMKQLLLLTILIGLISCNPSSEPSLDEKANKAVQKLDTLLKLDELQKSQVKQLALISAELLKQAEEEQKDNPKKIMALKQSIGKSFDQKLMEVLRADQAQIYTQYKDRLKEQQLAKLQKSMKKKNLFKVDTSQAN